MKRAFLLIAIILILAPSAFAGRELKQSAAANVVLLLVNGTDKATGEAGLSPTVTLSKDGGAFAAPSDGAATDRGSGFYSVSLNGTDTGTLGDLIVNAVDASGAADPTARMLVVVENIESETYAKTNTAITNIAAAQADLDNPTQYKADVSNLDVAVSSRAAASTALSNVTWTDARASYISAIWGKLPGQYIMGSANTASYDAFISGIKGKTDLLNFTGTDVKATLDGETVTASSVTDKTGYSLAADQNTVTIGLVNGLTAAAKAEVNAEADTALSDYDPPTKAELDAAQAAIIANTPTAAANADAVWDEAASGHLGAGSTGAILNGSSASGIADAVWDELVSAHQSGNSTGALLNSIAVTQTGNIGTGVLQNLVTSTDSSAQTIVRGDVKAFTFNLGSSWDLTGKRAYFIAKADRTAANSTAIVNRECTVTDAANGVAVITLTATETATVGTYYAEVEIRDADGTSNPRTARQFTLKISQDVRQ